MELRQKIASAVLLAWIQVIFSNCMPPGFSAVSIKSLNYRPKTPYMNRRIKNSLMDIAVANDSKVIRFPEVEYPSADQIGEYCVFQNDFENIFKARVTDKLTKTSPELRNLTKREANQKPGYGMITNSRLTLPRSIADLEYDVAPQPDCFRRTSFFPDVEYPLSARDMWIPNSWNRLFDANTDRPVNMYVQSRNPLIQSKDAYFKYATSPQKRIIEKKNPNNMGKEKTSNINSALSKKIKSSNCVILPSSAPTKATGTLDNAASIKRKANTRIAQRISDLLRIGTASYKYIGRQDGNLSRSTADISSESVPTTRVYTNENPTAVSPDPGIACAKTDSPINYFNSLIINPDQLLGCERELSLSVNNWSSTTISPLLSTGLSTNSLVGPGNHTTSVGSTVSKINNLGIFDIYENLNFDSNESIITWPTRPECSDNLIFLDPQTKSLSQGDYCNNNSQFKEHNSVSDDSYSSIPNSVPSKPDSIVSVVDLYSIISDQVALAKTKSKQLSPITLENLEANDESISPLDDTNTTFQSKYSDDTWASCTEVPYDSLDSYTDHVNDIWSAFANDSCVICQPISEYSDDACLLFLGAITPTRQDHDTYLDVS